MATILVIDDERLLCDLLQEMLRRQGHEVFTAYSGREGVESYKRQRPQVTLLDLHLPDINGIMERATLRRAARALMMKKAAVSPNTYISPYHRMAIGPSLIRTGSMSGFGSTGASYGGQRLFSSLCLDERASFR